MKLNFKSGLIKNFGYQAAITSPGMIGNTPGVLFSNNGGKLAGLFNPDGTGFVGFSLNGGERGWIKVQLSNIGSTTQINSFTIVSWAYNDIAGGPILAGQTVTAAVPEPGTMAMGPLASGAAGLVALRKAKAAAANAEAATSVA